jgi:uncharacterized protein (TIGR02246 family)
MDAELRQATERYAQLVRKMDNAAIAQMFTPDGELVAPGKTPPRGPAEIGQYLDGFKQYQVRSEVMTVDNVLANGLSAHVTGRYDQKVRLPAGNEVEAKGRYEADWNRGDDGVWRLRRLAAYPG